MRGNKTLEGEGVFMNGLNRRKVNGCWGECVKWVEHPVTLQYSFRFIIVKEDTLVFLFVLDFIDLFVSRCKRCEFDYIHLSQNLL